MNVSEHNCLINHYEANMLAQIANSFRTLAKSQKALWRALLFLALNTGGGGSIKSYSGFMPIPTFFTCLTRRLLPKSTPVYDGSITEPLQISNRKSNM